MEHNTKMFDSSTLDLHQVISPMHFGPFSVCVCT